MYLKQFQKATERFETEELAIERYVELGDIFNWIYKDDGSGGHFHSAVCELDDAPDMARQMKGISD